MHDLFDLCGCVAWFCGGLPVPV